jgi:hypothetical protein
MEMVILPAIDPEAQLAQEQAYLITVYLRILADQHDKQHAFRLQEIGEFHALVHHLLELADEKADAGQAYASARRLLEDTRRLLDINVPDYSMLAAQARELREVADRLVGVLIADGGTKGRRADAAAQLLLAQAEKESIRERAWYLKLGIDPNPGELPPLPTLLRRDKE